MLGVRVERRLQRVERRRRRRYIELEDERRFVPKMQRPAASLGTDGINAAKE